HRGMPTRDPREVGCETAARRRRDDEQREPDVVRQVERAGEQERNTREENYVEDQAADQEADLFRSLFLFRWLPRPQSEANGEHHRHEVDCGENPTGRKAEQLHAAGASAGTGSWRIRMLELIVLADAISAR